MPPSWPPWKRKYAVGTLMKRMSGGWMTAVKIPDCRTARTAKMQPTTYDEAKTMPSSLLPVPAS